MDETRSAVVVAVPEAEPAVGRWRDAFDPAARLGVPAHVTVLFPWVPPKLIDAPTLEALAEVVAAQAAFKFRFDEVRSFGDDVLYLAPEPAGGFVAFTQALEVRFGLPPYEGQFDEVTPHLTVAVAPADFDAIRSALKPLLPISSIATRVNFMVEGADGYWRTEAVYSLGSAA